MINLVEYILTKNSCLSIFSEGSYVDALDLVFEILNVCDDIVSGDTVIDNASDF